MELNFNSVETIANLNASAAFQVDSGKVFKDDVDICPVIIDKKLSYIPWGGDNNLPYHILDLIESDETLSTCQQFNAEVCYGSVLRYLISQLMKQTGGGFKNLSMAADFEDIIKDVKGKDAKDLC